MSEDNVSISFDITGAAPDREPLADLLRRYAQESGCEAPDISFSGATARALLAFCSFDTSVLERLAEELQRLGAKEVVFTAWFDNVGEEAVYAALGGQLLRFASMSELREYKAEQARGPQPVAFDYGKDKTNRTAIVRLKVNPGRQRDRLASVFRAVMVQPSEEAYAQFHAAFAGLAKSKTHDIKWCGLKWKDQQRWFEGPAELIHGVRFVTEDEAHLYLGFDLDNLGLAFGLGGNRTWDEEIENLVYVFAALDGVQKVWAKFRPGANTVKELYTYYPGMGDTAVVVRRPITDDSEWPRLA